MALKSTCLSGVYYSAGIEFRNHSYSTRKLHFMYVVFFPLFFHSLVVCHFATAVDEILWFRVECSQPWTWLSLLVDLNANLAIFSFLSFLNKDSKFRCNHNKAFVVQNLKKITQLIWSLLLVALLKFSSSEEATKMCAIILVVFYLLTCKSVNFAVV